MITVFFLIISSAIATTKLGFIESQSLRLSSKERADSLFIPFHYPKNLKHLELNATLLGKNDDYLLYKDLVSKDQERITNRLNHSFGVPYDAHAKTNMVYRYHEFTQQFSFNSSALAFIKDPVFPEFKTFMYYDQWGTSAYLFKPIKNLQFKPQIGYGRRKIINKNFTTGDFVNQPPNLKLKRSKWHYQSEFSFNTIYSIPLFQILFELNSLPLTNSDYDYWDSFLGMRTINLASLFSDKLQLVSFFAGYSPFYGGYYDVKRTMKFGTQIYFKENLGFNVFTTDQMLFGGQLIAHFNHIEIDLYSIKRAYDDYLLYQSRLYGMNLKFLF